MGTKIEEALTLILKKFPRYWEDDNLIKNKVVEDLRNDNTELLSAVMKDEIIKNSFFIKIEDNYIFQKDKLIDVLRYKSYWHSSYTKYANKIGLTSEGKYLDYNSDVVLDFPHKDCVLEGGMTKEDVSKDEVYYHNILGKEEIDVLLEPKVLTNVKKYDSEGEHEVNTFSENDNLIIKGNNLIALHSIKKRYQGKIQTIIIDPPYYFLGNKSADAFAYNSNYKLSTWLTFMKNRLEIARDFLKENGSIFITISSQGAHYLKVLCDDIFGSENFISDITWQSRKSVSSDGLISTSSNHILCYAKNKNKINKNDFRLALDVENFRFDDNDGRGKYKVEPFDAPEKRKNLEYKIINPTTKEEYFPTEGRHWRTTEEDFIGLLKENRIKFGVNGKSKPQLKVYLEDAIKNSKGKTATSIWIDKFDEEVLWTETATTTNGTKHQQSIFGKIVFENPKPEQLIKRIIELSTNERDIVMDFFMGSGTTQSTAHKMNRQYIGIEQMDYIDDVSIVRMNKVIEGEQGGISKEVNWKGGGAFTYISLYTLNQYYAQKIVNSEDTLSLKEILKELIDKGNINYNIEVNKLLNCDFDGLTLQEMKKILLSILDKNIMYLSYSEIDDEDYLISKDIKYFNNKFYEVNSND